MKESDLNRIISSSFNAAGFYGYKIPDPPQQSIKSGGKRPFDLFAVLPSHSLYVESKIIKSPYFPFSRIEPHQLENLTRIQTINPNTLCLLAICLYTPRKVKRVYWFGITCIKEMIDSGKKSICKSDFNYLDMEGKFIDIKKDYLPVDQIEFKVINLQPIFTDLTNKV